MPGDAMAERLCGLPDVPFVACLTLNVGHGKRNVTYSVLKERCQSYERTHATARAMARERACGPLCHLSSVGENSELGRTDLITGVALLAANRRNRGVGVVESVPQRRIGCESQRLTVKKVFEGMDG